MNSELYDLPVLLVDLPSALHYNVFTDTSLSGDFVVLQQIFRCSSLIFRYLPSALHYNVFTEHFTFR
jgi:hypothetical protein